MVEDKYSLSHRNPFSAEHAISSFRNLDFDPISSICEIIDNKGVPMREKNIIEFGKKHNIKDG